jgi:hypothetical protein
MDVMLFEPENNWFDFVSDYPLYFTNYPPWQLTTRWQTEMHEIAVMLFIFNPDRAAIILCTQLLNISPV